MDVATGTALYYAIKQDATVWNAISGSFYPNYLPQKQASYPAVVWGQLSDDMLPSKDGPINDGYRFQMDIFAKDYGAAQNIAQQLKSLLKWKHIDVPQLGYCRITYKDAGDARYEEEMELVHIIQDYKVRVVRPIQNS